ncbi:MAG: MarR family transcriptional regulator [Hungatella sp.]|nr:MarR family transcriptional regulator [Hungatella sp.]
MTERIKQRRSTPEARLIEKYIRTNRRHKRALEQELSSTGVYRSQHQILMAIAENPNVSQKELAGMRGISTATMAVSLKKLEQSGYLKREVDLKDNRCNQICITERGREVITQSMAIFDEMEQRMFQGFTQEDFQALGELLDRIYDNMEFYFKDRE